MVDKYTHASDEDELFFDMLKDEFAFFYAITVTIMDVLKSTQPSDQDSA